MTSTAPLPGASGLRVRPFPGRFEGALPRHYFGDNAFATHLVNGISILFPAGERFFVRSVRRFLDQLDGDPELRATVRAFGQQEGHHAQAHERMIAELEAQGFGVRSFIAAYEKLAWGRIEPLASRELRLSVTAALEHLTAIMAEHFIRRGTAEAMTSVMGDLLAWHAAEEIEHRAVAFEVLQRVAPSYGLRAAGMLVAVVLLPPFWAAATWTFLRDERSLLPHLVGLARLRGKLPFGAMIFVRGVADYLRPAFHPSQATHLDGLADEVLRRGGYALRGASTASR